MTQQQAQQTDQANELPQAGEMFRCQQCGMELEITQDCRCAQGTPRLECCGRPLKKV
jgi:hypothetical protein